MEYLQTQALEAGEHEEAKVAAQVQNSIQFEAELVEVEADAIREERERVDAFEQLIEITREYSPEFAEAASKDHSTLLRKWPLSATQDLVCPPHKRRRGHQLFPRCKGLLPSIT